MKHEILVVFASSLIGNDGNGIRLCTALKEVGAQDAPRLSDPLVFAGFHFWQLSDPKCSDGVTTHYFEPAGRVRNESFELRADILADKRSRKRGHAKHTTLIAGVVVGHKSHTTVGLINELKKQGYAVFVGDRVKGGFKPHA